MPGSGEIKSGKILVKDIFGQMWFRVPEYQRPYVWTSDNVTELLEDLTFAQAEKPNDEYFLGSFVYQSKRVAQSEGQEFDENDLLDGQQRMSTLLMLLAVIRDRTDNSEAKQACQKRIYQEANEFENIPGHTRLKFATREKVQEFIDQYVRAEDGTNKRDDLDNIKRDNVSVQNMVQAILEMHKFLEERPVDLEKLLYFLLNRVLLVYVSAENLEDAFRLFTILNSRGVPLRNSDILKSINLGALRTEEEKLRYAMMWEEAENELGEDFDRFLEYVRTILVKDKARMSLLQEFKEKIYGERNKSIGERKPALLKKGRDTFELMKKYLEHHRTVFSADNLQEFGNRKFDNLVKVMLKGLPATDWIPPLLRYFDRFKFDRILEFLKKLDNKCSADWISRYTPTERIDGMNRVIHVIDEAGRPDEVLRADCFHIDGRSFMTEVLDCVYSKRYVKYLLLKLDYLHQDHSHLMSIETLSVEHILPRNPSDESRWVRDFSETERDKWTDRLGNLVLLSRRKNSSLGRLDYEEKKKRYFEKNITTCPNSLRVLQNDEWTLTELKKNHNDVLKKLREHYEIEDEPYNP